MGGGTRFEAGGPDYPAHPGKLPALALALSPSPTANGLAGARNATCWASSRTYFRWLTRQNVILHNPASELELPRMEKRLPQEVLTLTRSRTASGRARRDRSTGRARPGHARTLLLDGSAAHRALPPGTGRPQHRAPHAPRPPGQRQERPHGARGPAGHRIGWNVT